MKEPKTEEKSAAFDKNEDTEEAKSCLMRDGLRHSEFVAHQKFS